MYLRRCADIKNMFYHIGSVRLVFHMIDTSSLIMHAVYVCTYVCVRVCVGTCRCVYIQRARLAFRARETHGRMCIDGRRGQGDVCVCVCVCVREFPSVTVVRTHPPQLFPTVLPNI